ncbi:MAG: class I SAM-dependent methyltransferase [Elusimicrobia bacterium]|nr:class I SAM-dependent methyltransferase [Elusimicrobiota bacterium]
MISAVKANKNYFREAYRSGLHGWEAEPSPYALRYLGRLRKKLPGAALLDLGCGEGRHAVAAARLGLRVIAVDTEPGALKRAKAKARAAGVTGLRFLKADALALPFARGSFDIILDFGCLHHQRKTDWPAYKRSILRALKPGGFLILSVFSPRFRFFKGTNRDWHIARGAYRRCFSKKDFPALFGKDFMVLSLTEAPNGFWHALLERGVK